jgi:hypothetical protein
MAARITEPAPGYIHGTKYEMPLMLHKRGGDVVCLGKIVVLYDGQKIGVLKDDVSADERVELFHGLGLDKIINEEDPAVIKE